jgi:hypothetical protein
MRRKRGFQEGTIECILRTRRIVMTEVGQGGTVRRVDGKVSVLDPPRLNCR